MGLGMSQTWVSIPALLFTTDGTSAFLSTSVQWKETSKCFSEIK